MTRTSEGLAAFVVDQLEELYRRMWVLRLLDMALEQLLGATAGDLEGADEDAHIADPRAGLPVRELLSNVVRHSGATTASVRLGITDEKCVLDVADDGVGVTGDTMARRLGEGHIGLASHRARVDAAGGVLVFLATPRGTHVCVELPLKR